MKKITLTCLVCTLLLIFAGGCREKSNIREDLQRVNITTELPPVYNEGSSRLADIDDDVYEQQLAACEMYNEAYNITKTSDYIEKYKGEVKDKRIGYYCNNRRKEIQLDIATKLNDNIYVMVKSVEDCDNINAYLKRVNFDAENFYDYYAEYTYGDNKEAALCKILLVFYERSNILAFRFMDDHREEIINAVIMEVQENSRSADDLNMRFARNNDLIEALNKMYGGVPSSYAESIREANVNLARRLLEEGRDLSEEEIEKLMHQLGEPTPQPSVSPTPEPTPIPTPEPTDGPTPQPKETAAAVPSTQPPAATDAPIRTNPPVVIKPTPRPATTQVPVAPATQTPVQSNTSQVTPEPEIFYLDID